MRYSTIINFLIPRIKRTNKIKVIKFLNLIVFLSIFALISSSLSLYFENKIDKLEKKVTQLEVNNFIFTNQLERTAKNIKITENFLLSEIENNSLLEIIGEISSEKIRLTNQRELYFDPFFLLQNIAFKNRNEITRVTRDAMLIVENLGDLDLVEKAISESKRIDKKLNKIISDESLYETKAPNENASKDAWDEHYIKYNEFNKQTKIVLQEQLNFFLNYSYPYFSSKNEAYDDEVTNNLEEISKLSNKETKTILYAFIIQVIIFLIIQSFEFSFEISSRRKNAKR